MTKQLFLRQRGLFEKASLFPSLPLTPASLLWKNEKLVNFSSHDYLGLSQHVDTRKNAIKYLLHYGSGICHPEIKNGYLECQKQIEEKYAEALGFSQTHFFSTRAHALNFLFDQFFDKEWTLFRDAYTGKGLQKLIHKWEEKTSHFYNLNTLESLLSSCSTSKRVIWSESLFSSTGQFADLDSLIDLAKKYEAFLIIDDSCAFALKGKQGLGLAQGRQDIDFILCSLDCGAGASGAFIASSEAVAPYFLKEFPLSRELALTFSSLGAIEAALELIPNLEGERMQLEQRTHWMRQQLNSFAIPLVSSPSHLIALACDNAKDAHEKWEKLLKRGILSEMSHIQLDKEKAYLLFAINVQHSPDELSNLSDVLRLIFKSDSQLASKNTACSSLIQK